MRLDNTNKEHCIGTQEQLVLKPADGCEGHGIYFGNNMTPSEWSDIVEAVLDKNYIMQKRITLPQKVVNLFDAGTIKKKCLYYDICPHFFINKGKIIGSGHTLMRFSENQIVNVTQGGGIGYYKE
jgi:uncharacterized circularly permuted ATP-grasp superfamily protein